MKVNWDDDIPNIWENKKCSKPPTSLRMALKCVHGNLCCRLAHGEKMYPDVLTISSCASNSKPRSQTDSKTIPKRTEAPPIARRMYLSLKQSVTPNMLLFLRNRQLNPNFWGQHDLQANYH